MKNMSSTQQKWQEIYSVFLKKRKNTSGWKRKAEHANTILNKFSRRIPLTKIVEADNRKKLSRELFDSENDFNYIIYVLCMGVQLGALGLDGDYLVVLRQDLM